MPDESTRPTELARRLGEAVTARGWTAATAESLTGGGIASVLSAAPGASDWFSGSIVAYTAEVKFDLLGVEPGPVVTEQCAATMAETAAELLGADLCVSVTGVGGPEPDEGEAPGTVWFGLVTPDGVHTEKAHFDGSPAEVLTATTERALELLGEAVGQPPP